MTSTTICTQCGQLNDSGDSNVCRGCLVARNFPPAPSTRKNRWVIQCGSNSNYYVKTCWFTRKMSGQKPTTTTTKDKTKALRFDTLEAAEATALKINAYCTLNEHHTVHRILSQGRQDDDI